MSDAKVRSLLVRPTQSVDLCFDTAGVIAYQNRDQTRLGSRVLTATNMALLYARLGEAEPGNMARLRMGAQAIRDALRPQTLFEQRNDMLGASVDQSIAQREVAILQKYKHKKQIVAAIAEMYPPDGDSAGRSYRLRELLKFWEQKTRALDETYRKAGMVDVVKGGVSETRNQGEVTNDVFVTPVTMRASSHEIRVTDPAGSVAQIHKVPDILTVPAAYRDGDWKPLTEGTPTFKNQVTVTKDGTHVQRTTTTGPEFQHPLYENLIQGTRAQLDLRDELLQSRLASYAAQELEGILDAELKALDLDVRRMQIEFAQTFLTSPVVGVVTAVYKDAGESVETGEPVVRVENDERILLVGLLQYRGLVRLGQTVKVESRAPFERLGMPLRLDGEVRAIRGHEADDDEWEIVIECENTARGMLPLNYHFDRDTTKVTLQ